METRSDNLLVEFPADATGLAHEDDFPDEFAESEAADEERRAQREYQRLQRIGEQSPNHTQGRVPHNPEPIEAYPASYPSPAPHPAGQPHAMQAEHAIAPCLRSLADAIADPDVSSALAEIHPTRDRVKVFPRQFNGNNHPPIGPTSPTCFGRNFLEGLLSRVPADYYEIECYVDGQLTLTTAVTPEDAESLHVSGIGALEEAPLTPVVTTPDPMMAVMDYVGALMKEQRASAAAQLAQFQEMIRDMRTASANDPIKGIGQRVLDASVANIEANIEKQIASAATGGPSAESGDLISQMKAVNAKREQLMDLLDVEEADDDDFDEDESGGWFDYAMEKAVDKFLGGEGSPLADEGDALLTQLDTSDIPPPPVEMTGGAA